MTNQNPLANLDKQTQIKLQEMQILEQSFQSLLMQKQAFQHELNETELALKEIDKAKDDIFKIVGSQIMIKATKEKLTEEMKHKKELIEVRLKNIDKQEKEFSEKLNSLRDEIMKKISGLKKPEKENK